MAAAPVGAELPAAAAPVVAELVAVAVAPVGAELASAEEPAGVARPVVARVALPVHQAAADPVRRERALQELRVGAMLAVPQRPRPEVVVRVGTADMAVEAAPARRAV